MVQNTKLAADTPAQSSLSPTVNLASSPYPGLRPFQPGDAAFFFGRDAQVREIVLRLKKARFVAVIGGSGSGKSSLVLAGAIPRLRASAIEEAGDFWLSVVSTPGTNHIESQGPLTRLARNFFQELDPSKCSADCFEQCLALLKRKGGLGLLVEHFATSMRHSGGVDLSRGDVQLNVLFLLDQFEELFHPSNSAPAVGAECTDLVNRIIEHFQAPHPQVCIALTMRSEHLNDCPRYQDLPDAINGSAYLVKRLDVAQLQQAIEEPALRFLRKRVAEERYRHALTRSPEKLPPWPPSVPFEGEVIARILEDSRAVLSQQDHADQLPLLQHLLFWMWRAAVERCPGCIVPDHICMDDLWAAIDPQGLSPRDATVNVCRPPCRTTATTFSAAVNRCRSAGS
jgi:energy-coupling factor transporter ATP-binding protein EcfA2